MDTASGTKAQKIQLLSCCGHSLRHEGPKEPAYGENKQGSPGIVIRCRDEPYAKLVVALEGTRIGLVSGGWRHTIAADKAGKLYAWGWNKVRPPFH